MPVKKQACCKSILKNIYIWTFHSGFNPYSLPLSFSVGVDVKQKFIIASHMYRNVKQERNIIWSVSVQSKEIRNPIESNAVLDT